MATKLKTTQDRLWFKTTGEGDVCDLLRFLEELLKTKETKGNSFESSRHTLWHWEYRDEYECQFKGEHCHKGECMCQTEKIYALVVAKLRKSMSDISISNYWMDLYLPSLFWTTYIGFQLCYQGKPALCFYFVYPGHRSSAKAMTEPLTVENLLTSSVFPIKRELCQKVFASGFESPSEEDMLSITSIPKNILEDKKYSEGRIRSVMHEAEVSHKVAITVLANLDWDEFSSLPKNWSNVLLKINWIKEEMDRS